MPSHTASRIRASAARAFDRWIDFLRFRRRLALFVFTFGPALALRGWLPEAYSADHVSLMWLLAAARGVLSDAAFCLALTLVLHRPLSRTAWGPLATGALLSMIYAGNHEHIYHNYAHANVALAELGLAREVLLGHFLTTGVLAKAAAALAVAGVASLAISAALQGGISTQRTGRPERATPGSTRSWPWLLCSVMVALAAGLPVGAAQPAFVQTGLAEANIRRLVNALRAPPRAPRNLGDAADGSDWFHQRDLSGTPAITFPSREPGLRPNILLVLIEGWDGNVLEAGFTPALASLAAENIHIPNVYAHQVQTHRGLYSILCGDYPNLLLTDAKADIVGEFGTLGPCLPEILAGQGYETVFMQSADLGFMRKDRFAAAVGFRDVRGAERFPDAPRSVWGVDDRTLMRSVAAHVAELAKGSAPWMATVLTSGTHPPYYVAPADSVREDSGARERAFRVADEATDDLIDKLRRDGLLRNTWVFVTSDEASTRFGRGTGPDYLEFLSRGYNRIGVVALTPGGQKRRLSGTFGAKDIMISVLDLLGLADTVPEARGHSLFRTYGVPAPIVYSSAYHDLFLVRQGGAVDLCRKNLDGCHAFAPDGRTGRSGAVALDADLMARAHAFARANDFGYEQAEHAGPIFSERGVLYRDREGRVLGNREIGVKAGERLVWRVRLAAPAANRNASRAALKVAKAGSLQFTKEWNLAPGEAISAVERRTYEHDAPVTSELFLYNDEGDGIYVREVTLAKYARSLEPAS